MPLHRLVLWVMTIAIAWLTAHGRRVVLLLLRTLVVRWLRRCIASHWGCYNKLVKKIELSSVAYYEVAAAVRTLVSDTEGHS